MLLIQLQCLGVGQDDPETTANVTSTAATSPKNSTPSNVSSHNDITLVPPSVTGDTQVTTTHNSETNDDIKTASQPAADNSEEKQKTDEDISTNSSNSTANNNNA